MPTLPKQPHRPNCNQTKIDLLDSIALEEVALSHLLNAESEKLQAFVGKCLDFPTSPSNHEILKFNRSVNQLVETILMKEWILLRKLEYVMEIECGCCHKPKCHCKEPFDPCKPLK